jgi:arsenite-transporting ATPase
VGKTTCAAAHAVAEAAAGRRVLVVSTDPAHSLGDAFGVKLSAAPRRIRPRLRALELDAPRAFARWLRDHRAALGDILEHGTWLDRNDVEAMMDLSVPGVDELVGLLEISRIAQAGTADLIVVDTAPTGHTLRLLASPETVSAVADAFDALQVQHRVIRGQLAGVARPEASDRLIELLHRQAIDLSRRLRDSRTAFHWVTLPEELSVEETADALATFDRSGLRVDEVIVNRVLPADGPCPICDRRRASESASIARILRSIGPRPVRLVPAVRREPRGITALTAMGMVLRARPSSVAGVRGSVAARPRPRGSAVSIPKRAATVSAEDVAGIAGAELLFFGGKGGVGKTTVAAAAAIRIARARPDARVLLLSTDPAHSLADVLGAPVGDVPQVVTNGPRNLLVREVDAPRALAARRGDLEAALGEIGAALGASAAGELPATELMDLAPPGVDELFGILSVFDARGDYGVIIVDTAPTGHALRLLEMPEKAREWVQLLLRVLLKYRSLVRPGQLAAELVKLSQSIRETQALVRDKARTRFVVVTRAAEVPRAETERLLTRLHRMRLATPAVVVNAMTLAPGECEWCRATAAAELRELAVLRRACGRKPRRCAIIQAPLSAPPPRGVSALEKWGVAWMAGM